MISRVLDWLWVHLGRVSPPPAVSLVETETRLARPRHAFARQRCARCGLEIAHTRGGWSWPHFCADGYGVVNESGTFQARGKRREPVLPIDVAPGTGDHQVSE